MLEKMEKEIKKEKGGVKELEEMVQEQEELLCKYGAWTSTVSWTSIELEQALLNKYRAWTSTVEQVSSLNKHCWTSIKLEQALQLDKHFYNKLFLTSYRSNLIRYIKLRKKKKTAPANSTWKICLVCSSLELLIICCPASNKNPISPNQLDMFIFKVLLWQQIRHMLVYLSAMFVSKRPGFNSRCDRPKSLKHFQWRAANLDNNTQHL